MIGAMKVVAVAGILLGAVGCSGGKAPAKDASIPVCGPSTSSVPAPVSSPEPEDEGFANPEEAAPYSAALIDLDLTNIAFCQRGMIPHSDDIRHMTSRQRQGCKEIQSATDVLEKAGIERPDGPMFVPFRAGTGSPFVAHDFLVKTNTDLTYAKEIKGHPKSRAEALQYVFNALKLVGCGSHDQWKACSADAF
jgi:hypothetical protein